MTKLEVLNELTGTSKVMFESGYNLGIRIGKTESESVEYGLDEVKSYEEMLGNDFSETWVNLSTGKRSIENH